MLRPSAFQNNGSGGNNQSSNNTNEISTSKSILRPSSFQLASGSGAQSANTSEEEPTTTTAVTGSPTEAAPSSSPSPSPSSSLSSPSPSILTSPASSSQTPVATSVALTAADSADDGNISSTTNNNSSLNSTDEENAEQKAANPFSSSSMKNTSIHEESGTEAAAKEPKETSGTEKSEAKSTTAVSPSMLAGKNIFAPSTTDLFAAAASKAPSTSNGSESIGFVFGQNIHERIVGAPSTSSFNSEETSRGPSGGGSESFAAAAASSASSSGIATSSTAKSNSNGSESKEESSVEDLTKAAREYEESRAQKRKYDEVETFTGEESESNVCDVNCKLFAFVASNWEERGPGSLRLNDSKDASGTKSSRVVFRTSGNLRVVLNTIVWKGMVVEKPSQKSLRLTAIDQTDKQIRIFLAQARPDDITSLYSALKKRIELEKEKADADGDAEDGLEGDTHVPDNKKDKKDWAGRCTYKVQRAIIHLSASKLFTLAKTVAFQLGIASAAENSNFTSKHQNFN